MTPDAARRPLIAGNWKLWGTRAQAADYCERLQALLPDERRRHADVGDLRAVHRARRLRRASCAAAGVAVYAQTMHQEETRRLHRRGLGARCSPRSAWTAWCSGTPSGASTTARPTARSRRRCPPRSTPGLEPILCVGETEEEREAGETQRKLGQQVQEGLEKVPDERLAEVVIAYEPIWAIGTGQGRHAGDRAGGDRVRARAGRRPLAGGGASGIRVLYGGSVKPDNAAEILAQPDVDGALVGGASLDPEGLRAHRGRRGRRRDRRAAVLVVLDGWGLAEPGPGNAVELADTPVFDELWER